MATATQHQKVEFEHPADYAAELTAPATGVRFLVIPKRRYLTIEGSAKPGEKEFSDAISSLYPVAYTLHFALKRKGIDAPIGALHGLYWIGRPDPITVDEFRALSLGRAKWSWRLMLPVPDGATEKDIMAAIAEVKAKKQPPLIDRLRSELWDEGTVRRCTSARITPRPQRSSGCTAQSKTQVFVCTDAITRSTSVIPTAPRRNGSRR